MQLGARLECVRSSSRVSEACQDGTMEFAGRRPRLTGRLSRVAEKLAGSWEGIGSGLNYAVGPRQEFTRRFAEGIGKLVGTHQEIIERRPEDLSEAAGLARVRSWFSLLIMKSCDH
ncbi:hypothetical protein GW17_00046227 [Ensete ventricosum]|nr:hypothetical protein GW17_00046227 [Ensete ventricosum]